MADSREWEWDMLRQRWCSSDGHYINRGWANPRTPLSVLNNYVDSWNQGINPFTGASEMATPFFTKKHYEQLAVVLKNSMSSLPNAEDKLDMYIGASMVVTALMAHFEKDNPRFDRQAFLKAIKEN